MRVSVENRVHKLEAATGVASRSCTCLRGRSVAYYPEDGQAKPSPICEDCGGLMVIIRVVYEQPQFPNYQV